MHDCFFLCMNVLFVGREAVVRRKTALFQLFKKVFSGV